MKNKKDKEREKKRKVELKKQQKKIVLKKEIRTERMTDSNESQRQKADKEV